MRRTNELALILFALHNSTHIHIHVSFRQQQKKIRKKTRTGLEYSVKIRSNFKTNTEKKYVTHPHT